MIISLKTYPKYKDSGVEWLHDIPVDWDVLPFKKIFRVSNERVEDTPSLDLALSISGYRGVEPRNIDTMEGQMPSENIDKYRIVRKGQLAVNTMWLNFAGLGVSGYDGYISPAYRAYNIDHVLDKKFAHHLLRSLRYVQKYSSLLYGLRPNSLQVKNEEFEKIEILVPPLETQNRIADFLDKKTEVIDELVAKKEKLIELLREKRAALITRAVTKGLNPKVKLKPSGIDWLGDIPEGWEIKKLKFVASVQASNIDKKSYEGEKDVLLCNYVDVYKNEFVDSTLLFMSATATSEQVIKLGLRVNDVLITKDSETPDDIGVPALVKETVKDLVSGYHLYLLRSLSNGVIGEYLFRFLQSRPVKGYFETRSNGVTRFGLSSYGVKNMSISIPSLLEQKQIADFLDVETGRIDKAVVLIESQIGKLKEYRSSLIYHAVTGKIKV